MLYYCLLASDVTEHWLNIQLCLCLFDRCECGIKFNVFVNEHLWMAPFFYYRDGKICLDLPKGWTLELTNAMISVLIRQSACEKMFVLSIKR